MKLKKRILVVFAFIIALTPQLYAQVQVGLKGGMNVSYLSFDNSDRNGIKAGYHVGVWSEIGLGKKFFIRPELLYSRKGCLFDAFTSIPTKGAIKVNYINLPILVGYRWLDKFSVLLGPELGYAVNGTLQIGSSLPMEDYQKLDIGLALGVAYKITPKWGVDMRYTHGFRKVISSSDMGINNPGDIAFTDGRNRVLQVGVLYLLK